MAIITVTEWNGKYSVQLTNTHIVWGQRRFTSPMRAVAYIKQLSDMGHTAPAKCPVTDKLGL